MLGSNVAKSANHQAVQFPGRKHMKILPLTIALALLGNVTSVIADETSDEAELIGVVRMFFAAMTAKDVDKMRQMMTSDGILYGYREGPDGLQVIRPTHKEYLNNLAAAEGELVERFWEPEVMLHGRMAIVWTPYDLYRNGEFSHCGINNFNFLRTEDGWKITGVVFSIETNGCVESPLGPFRPEP